MLLLDQVKLPDELVVLGLESEHYLARLVKLLVHTLQEPKLVPELLILGLGIRQAVLQSLVLLLQLLHFTSDSHLHVLVFLFANP